jgi:putative membrane protein
MTNSIERLFNRTPGQRRWMLGALTAGVILVPLVVAGFFAGALGSSSTHSRSVPAVVVNNDTMVTTTAADGSKQQVLAGRQLVTELTGKNSTGLDWTISNSEDAKHSLASGAAYAVVTIPKDFSKSVLSISGDHPQKAKLSIRTDDAHSYLAGSVASSVGSAMTRSLGTTITAHYLEGLYGALAGTGDSLSKAADGATTLSSGVGTLAAGMHTLADGAATAANGAASLSDGIDSYTNGVDSLSAGASQLADQTASVGQFGSGVAAYANGTKQLSDALAAAVPDLQSADPVVSEKAKATVAYLSSQLTGATANASALASGAGQLGAVHDGAAGLADGAARLSGGSAELRSGAGALSDGVSQLAAGAAASASGASQLRSGADQLATGLQSGAKQTSSTRAAKQAAEVVADPVGYTVSRANHIDSVGPVIGMVLIPISLWIGSIAIFLLLKPMSAIGLASTASSSRILLRGLSRAGGFALAQAVTLTGLLHVSLGVSWPLLPATLAFSMLLALVFTAVHYLLTAAFGRVGIVLSIVLLALQLTGVPGLLPLQLVSAPFQAISPFLPLTYAIDGMQGIVAGVGGAAVAIPSLVLLVTGALSVAVSFWIIVRKRGARSFGFALARRSA